MPRLEMKEGNTGPCWKCGKQLFVRMTKGSDKYPPKLQRQEHIDGTNPPSYQSHYQFNKETNETSCRGQPIISDDPNQSQIVSDTIPVIKELSEIDKKVSAAIEKESYERTTLKIAKLRGVEKACKDYGITNGATIGIIFNSVDKEGNGE